MPPPSDVYVLIPITHEYITLYGKRDFTYVIKLRILEKNYPVLSSGSIVIIRAIREAGVISARKRQYVSTEAEVRKERCDTEGFEDGGRGR